MGWLHLTDSPELWAPKKIWQLLIHAHRGLNRMPTGLLCNSKQAGTYREDAPDPGVACNEGHRQQWPRSHGSIHGGLGSVGAQGDATCVKDVERHVRASLPTGTF
jgi:hypothetical protein